MLFGCDASKPNNGTKPILEARLVMGVWVI